MCTNQRSQRRQSRSYIWDTPTVNKTARNDNTDRTARAGQGWDNCGRKFGKDICDRTTGTGTARIGQPGWASMDMPERTG
jgi:hypothetical protein